MATEFQVTFDSADPGAHAAFWAEAMHYVQQPPPPGFDSWDAFSETLPPDRRNSASASEDPAAAGPRIFFQRVPEGKAAKNRVHLDVETDDLDALVAHGATVLRAKGDGGIGWTVLADPDGNEFCAFTD